MSGVSTPNGLLERLSRGSSQDWNSTKDELTAEHDRTTQQLQQAEATATLGKQALTEATAAWATTANKDPRLEEAVQAAAKASANASAVAAEAHGAETSAREALQAHKNQGNTGPYGRN
jgi:ABC-type transporter Mla subunit MlaD